MGKAADNERKKLRATFYNNLAVGTLLGAVYLPMISFLYTPIAQLRPSGDDVWYTAVGFVGALAVGVLMRVKANQIIKTVED